MLSRIAEARLLRLLRGFPIVVLTGPRQSGKTTLARHALPGHAYVSLEDPDVRRRAAADPRGFVLSHAGPLVLDEAQRLPELLSYLQTAVDADRRPGRFVVTGSQNLLLSEAVSQSLAGRAGFLELLPLAYTEGGGLFDRLALDELLLRGAYPAVHTTDVDASDWHASYVASYLERDVRQISRIADLLQFHRFMRMLASRCGQLLNLNGLAGDLGVAQTTARDWLGVLEATYVVFRLPPYFRSFGKRLVKTPKQPVEFKSGATFQTEWLKSLHTWQRHAAAADQGPPLLISAAPGNQQVQGVGTAYWRDAFRALAPAAAAVPNAASARSSNGARSRS